MKHKSLFYNFYKFSVTDWTVDLDTMEIFPFPEGRMMKEEINKRRTFAIISHPDAGKTTLTEKFCYMAKAINLAGSVKGKKTAKHAVSDWMEIEKREVSP